MVCLVVMMDIGDMVEKIFSGRWIAGATIADSLSITKKFNRVGVETMINYLGEDFTNIDDVNNSLAMYMRILKSIKSAGRQASISVKPSQIGMLISDKVLNSNYKKIITKAKRYGVFVWLDMEESEYVDKTIKLYLSNVKAGNTGICIQAYLRRSESDIKVLVGKKAVIRLVKGAYSENQKISYPNRMAVTKNYYKLMNYLFKKSGRFMIATHDKKVVLEALKANKTYSRDVTYAMLNGIQNRYLVELAESGEKTSVYVPFGPKWFGYSIRRLKEAGHAYLLFLSLFNNQGV